MLSYGILSTYPPTQCGLATFSRALVESLGSADDLVEVVRVVDGHEISPHPLTPHPLTPHPLTPHPEVAHQWVRGDRGTGVAAALNHYDVAIIQHEYGIFGGPDGRDVLEVMRGLRIPAIAVLHTVLVTPTSSQRLILEEMVRLSAAVVTMTETARTRLIAHYQVDPGKVQVIPHGAIDNRGPFRSGRIATAPVVLTWGLLGEGKGIEWAIKAMAQLTTLVSPPEYHVVGETHPRVLQKHGERYREMLQASAHECGVADMVHFDARYLDPVDLRRLVRQADIILLPYDSREQVTSGVLIEAVTAGKPIVSTGFPHAVELLSSGAGLIVERQDPTAIADALRRVLTEPGLARSMAAEASRIAPELLWSSVADKYRAVAGRIAGADDVLVSA